MFDAARFGELLEPLYASVLDFSALGVFNQRLAEATDSHITGVLVHDVAGGRGSVSRMHGVDEARIATMLADVDLREDPWMRRVTPQLAIGRVLDTEDFMPRREAMRHGFYNAYYRRLGIVQQVASVGLYDGASSVTLSLCHGDARRVYGEGELGLLRALTPHWINAYAMRRRIHGLEQRAATLEQAMTCAPVAMFMLGRDLRIARCNAAAEHLLGLGLLSRAGGMLVAAGSSGTLLLAMLHRALAGTSRLQGGDVEKLLMRDGAGQPRLVLTAHRLPAWSQESGELLVFAREVGGAAASLAATLQGLFRLTEAEARLAVALHRHADAALAARECGITPATAQTRLKTIYDKTGARGQAGLVRLVATVAGTCGA